jgi:hypothetical protein
VTDKFISAVFSTTVTGFHNYNLPQTHELHMDIGSCTGFSILATRDTKTCRIITSVSRATMKCNSGELNERQENMQNQHINDQSKHYISNQSTETSHRINHAHKRSIEWTCLHTNSVLNLLNPHTTCHDTQTSSGPKHNSSTETA